MNKKLKKVLVILLIVFICSFCGLSFGQYLPNAPFKPEIAPDFTLKDLQGNKFNLHKQIGAPVLLFFGATWCPTCRSEIPAYKEIYKKYSTRGLTVIYINIMEPATKVAKFVKAYDLPYRILLDNDGSVAESFGIEGVPALFLLDKEGRLIKETHMTEDLPLRKLFPATK
jgi:peroxiredoxin